MLEGQERVLRRTAGARSEQEQGKRLWARVELGLESESEQGRGRELRRGQYSRWRPESGQVPKFGPKAEIEQ